MRIAKNGDLLKLIALVAQLRETTLCAAYSQTPVLTYRIPQNTKVSLPKQRLEAY